jgi:hypothetical protein
VLAVSVFDPLNQPYGATPVEEDDKQYLLEPHRGIETMAELNDVESSNIADARFWIRDEALDVPDCLLSSNGRPTSTHCGSSTRIATTPAHSCSSP